MTFPLLFQDLNVQMEEEEGIEQFDTASEISFQNRKKELGSLYREFRQALANMKALPEFSTDSVDRPDEDRFYRSEASDVETNYQLRGILRELQSMRDETEELKSMLSRVKPGRAHQVRSVVSKIDSVLRIIGGHMERVHALLV